MPVSRQVDVERSREREKTAKPPVAAEPRESIDPVARVA
jgi:hypothetical protein